MKKIEFLEIERIIYNEISSSKYENEEVSISNFVNLTEKIKTDIYKKYGEM